MSVCRSTSQRQQFQSCQCNIKEMMTSSEVGGKAQVCCIEEKGTVKDRLKLDKDERKGKKPTWRDCLQSARQTWREVNPYNVGDIVKKVTLFKHCVNNACFCTCVNWLAIRKIRSCIHQIFPLITLLRQVQGKGRTNKFES